MKIYNYTNTSKNKGIFKTIIPLNEELGKTKILTKNINGSDVKYLSGVATNNMVDKENEVMSKSFITKMRSQVQGINVFADHVHTIEKTVGYIESVSGDDTQLILDTALESEDDNPLVKTILNKINHGTKIGYSIGGIITKARKYFDENLKKWVNEIQDGLIVEISLTPLPAAYDTWVTPITKSLDEMMSDSKTIVEEIGDNKDDINITKILSEAVEKENLTNKLYDLFYTYISLVWDIVFDDEIPVDEKNQKISIINDEYTQLVSELSSRIANLVEVEVEDVSPLNSVMNN